MEGIFIPMEFYKIKEIKGLERDVLAIYKYFTENGNYKCCSLSNIQIADDLDIERRYVIKIKNHLKELGFIKVDGRSVYYLGVNHSSPEECTTVHPGGVNHSSPGGCTTVHQGGEPQFTEECTTVHSIGEPQFTQKKKEEKKENKEEGKKAELTKIDLLFNLLPQEYLTPEKKEVIIEWLNNNEKFNNTSYTDFKEGNKESWVIGAKEVVDKKFPKEYYVAPKVEPKKEEHNWWDD